MRYGNSHPQCTNVTGLTQVPISTVIVIASMMSVKYVGCERCTFASSSSYFLGDL